MERVGHGRHARSAPHAPGQPRFRRPAPRYLALALLLCLASVPTAVLWPGGPSADAATPATVRLGHPPPLPIGAEPGSSLPSSAPLEIEVVLAPRDPAALGAFANAVTTVGGPQDGRFLAPGQFASRFGAGPTAVSAVTTALERAGLHPGPVSGNGLAIPVRAAAGAVARAFGTGFRQYRLRDDRTVFANTVAPTLVSTAAPYVQAVVGLDDLAVPAPTVQPAPATTTARPTRTVSVRPVPHVGDGGPKACSTASGDATADSAETTDKVASAYGFGNLYSAGDLGSGTTVALFELQGYNAGDITAYQSCYGTDASVTSVAIDGGPGKTSGVSEADVDIEQVAGLAPGAHILVYEGPNTDAGAYDTYNDIVSNDQASIVSTSWGLCEPEEGTEAANAEDVLFEEAAAQGQGVFAAAGDQGSEDCLSSGYSGDTLAVDDPASQPFVTGAGGTSWSSPGTPPAETAWNDGPTCCWGAGGGGISSLWAMPTYQSSSTVPGVLSKYSSGAPCGATGGSDCREVPDVSALAGPFPYLEYVNGNWGAWGGTSLAAPFWASLTALADASSACSNRNIGFANPALYQAAASDPSAFNDVTSGNNDLSGDNGGLYLAGPGYDLATGLGTPEAGPLAGALCAASAPSPVVVHDPGDQTSVLGSTVSLHMDATDSTPGQTLTYRATGLPGGLSINSTDGLISGKTTSAGTFVVTVTAKDGNGASGWTSFDWTVSNAVTSASQATATVRQPFSFTFTATGSPTSMSVAGTRPKGIKRNQSGGSASLSGTPSAKDTPGSYRLVVTATYGKGKSATTATQSFTLVLRAG